MSARHAGWILGAAALIAVVLDLGWLFTTAEGPFQTLFTPHRLLIFSALVKLASLLLGAWWCFASARLFEVGLKTRTAWRLLACAIAAMAIGQLCMAPQQVMTGTSPFPSVGDAFFVAAYPLLIASFLVFILAYQQSGMPLCSTRQRALVASGTTLLSVIIAVLVLPPVLRAPTPWLETTLNAFYPIADLVLLIPLALLFRITSRMSGGKIGQVWLIMLCGFAFMALADIFFAYYSTLGKASLDPVVHATFTTAYYLVALGANRKIRLLTE
jgi:hypothetical protein